MVSRKRFEPGAIQFQNIHFAKLGGISFFILNFKIEKKKILIPKTTLNIKKIYVSTLTNVYVTLQFGEIYHL